MKIFKTSRPILATELKQFLDENLIALFEKQRQVVLDLKIVLNDNAIEITNDENYDSALFSIVTDSNQLQVTKSEHYTDDVNALAIEDILYTLLPKYPGGAILYKEGEN